MADDLTAYPRSFFECEERLAALRSELEQVTKDAAMQYLRAEENEARYLQHVAIEARTQQKLNAANARAVRAIEGLRKIEVLLRDLNVNSAYIAASDLLRELDAQSASSEQTDMASPRDEDREGTK